MAKVDEDASLEFKWLKKRRLGGKEMKVRFYESFIYDGVTYMLYDCVYMYKEGLREPYIGKLIKIWEHLDNKTKKVKVHWFFRPEEISTWLRDTKTLENEILFASGEGVGLSNVSPLEAIAGKCNVLCVSKDSRNPQPSDVELKDADFIFYRTFDVQSCTISDKIDEKVGGVEIKYIFNRKEDENISPLLENSSDKKDDEVEAKERNETPAGSDKLHDQPTTLKSDGKKPPKEKRAELEVAQDAERLKDMPSKKSKVEKASGTSGKNLEVAKTDSCVAKTDEQNLRLKSDKNPRGSDKLDDRPLKKTKLDDKIPPKEKQVELEVDRDSKKLNDMPSNKSKVDNPEASGTFGSTEEKTNQKNGKVLLGSDKGKNLTKVTDDLEGKTLKKTKAEGSFKMPDNLKNGSVQKPDNLVATSASKSGIVPNSLGVNKEPKGKLSMSGSSKVSALSTDGDKKTTYEEFVVGPKPNADKSGWFKRLPWEDRLKNAYDQGTAILLHNVDPDYTSGEVEDIIWHAFSENSEAKILQRIAVSSPHYCQALILLKTKEVAQRILAKLDEECLMLSNGRPLVGTPCPPISSRKNSKFFGHLVIDKCKSQYHREMDEAASTSHFSQPNTIEYDMAMEWCLLQSRSKKWWDLFHKQQRDELKKHKTTLLKK